MKQVFLVLVLSLFVSAAGYSQITVDPVVTQDPTCLDPTGAEITVTVGGGIDPYTVFINSIPPGYTESIVGTPGQTVFVFPAGGHPPIGEGTYLITATDSDIPFNFNSKNVFLTIAQPVVTVPGAAVEICENDGIDNLLARVSAAPAGGTFTFSGTGVTGNSFDPTGLNGLISIGVQYDLGSCTVNETFEYNVNAAPTPTINGLSSVCEGTTGVVYSTEAGQANYVWSVSAGGTITPAGNTATVTWNTAGPQFVTVNYENAAGCSATVPTTYNVTVNPLPVPTIGGQASVCIGDTELYTTEAGNTNYSWSVLGGAISSGGGVNDNTISITWNTSGAQSVSVNYTDPNGCTAGAPTVFPVTVNNLPTPTITGPLTVCEASTGNMYTTEAGQSNYVWTISAGGTVTSGGGASDNTVTVTWSTAGPQTVSVNYDNAAGCAALAATVENVTVNALPTPTLGGPNDVCEASTGNVYTTEAGQSNYVWTVSAGGTITNGGGAADNTIEITWLGSGAQTVSVNYDNVAGCDALAATVYNVNVNALPTPSLTGPATVCDGSAGNTYTTDAGMTNYNWVVVGGVVSLGGGIGDNSVTVTWNTVGAQSVSVNYEDANGCTAASATVFPVTVNALPVPALAGATVVCQNATEIYSTDAGQTNYSWLVSPPASGTVVSGGSVTDNFIEIQWTSNGAVSINYENAGGCTGVAPTSANVTVNPLPTPTLSGPNDVCEGSTDNLYTTEAGQSNYVWVISAGGTVTTGGTAVDNTVTITWTGTGAQSVSVNYEDANSCSAASATVYNVNVNPLPVPTLTGPLVACEGLTGATYTTEAGQANYNWLVSGGGTVTNGGGVTDDFVEVTWSGSGAQTVSVNYEDANTCTAASATVVNVSVDAIPSSMTFTGPVNPICEDESATLDIQIAGGTGPFELDLSTDGGGTVSETVAIPDNALLNYMTAPLVSSTTYTVMEVRDLGTGCVMDPADFAGDVTVTVNPKAIVLPLPVLNVCITDTDFTLVGFVAGSATTGTWTLENNGVPANLSPTTPGALPGQFNATYTLDPGDVSTVLTFRITTDDPDPGPGGCDEVFAEINVPVSPAAPATAPVVSGAAEVCTSSAMETYMATTVPDATTYIWDLGTSGATLIAGQGTTTIDVDFSTSVPGDYTFSAMASNGCGDGPAQTFDVTVNAGPAITTQPVDVAACENTDATFSVAATAASVAYQWEESTDGVIFTPMGGENAATLVLPGVTTAMDGQSYRVVVSGAGCPSVTSDVAVLAVNVQAVINTQPANQTVCMDDNVTFSVTATDATGYQWEESTDGVNFVAITGETLADLQLTNVPLASNGNLYRVIVESAGCTDVTSAFAELTVNDCTPPDCDSFTVQVDTPTNASCGSTNGQFTLVPDGGVAPYNIEVDKNDGSGFVQSAADVTGLAPGSYAYRVTDDQGCEFTGSVILGEKQLVAEFTDISDPLCNGDNGSVTITVTTGAGNYEFSIDNQATWTGFVSGEAVLIPPGTDYTVLVRDNTGDFCSTASALITIGNPSMISYTVDAITESVPERASGTINFVSISGGAAGYEMDVELVTPTAPDQYQPQIVDRVGIPVPQDASGTSAVLVDDLFAGFYQIYIRDANGCEVEVLTSADLELEVPMDNNLFIPNVFTPNGDGVNDVFFIRNMPEDAPTSVVITNRYGKTVYNNSSYSNDWDANGLADGVYYYSVSLPTEQVKGWVEVWRGTR